LAIDGDVQGGAERFAAAMEMLPPFGRDPEVEAERMAAAGLIAEGRYLARGGNVSEAKTHFEAALALEPELGYDAQQYAEDLAVASLLGRGRYQALAGDATSAVESFEAAETIEELLWDPYAEAELLSVVARADSAYRQAIRAGEIDSYGRAVEFQELALERTLADTTRDRITEHMGTLYLGMAERQERSGAAEAAGRSYRLSLESARQVADRDLEARVELALGLNAFNQGDFDEAGRAWRNAVALADHLASTGEADAYNNLAYLYSVTDANLDDAADLIERALAIAGPLGYMLDTQAWVFYRQGRCSEALNTIAEALERYGGAGVDGEVDEHYVTIQCSCGDPLAAADALDAWGEVPDPVQEAYGMCPKKN
jgi:tetratricopeptide (TPR) repeat protein